MSKRNAEYRHVRETYWNEVCVLPRTPRHQYWYRYIATAGNFALAPPKEYAYPKIKNPKLRGVACKHVIHALTRLQSSSWQLSIARALQRLRRK